MTSGLLLLVMLETPQLDASDARRSPRPPPAPRTEFGIVPLAGGDTDYGLGLGFLANLAGFDPAVTPYAWRLEAGAFVN